MATRTEIESLLVEHLAAPASSWSVGEFGVLAEFHHGGSGIELHGPLTASTRGGAIRIQPHPEIRVLAYETPSPNPRLWNHGIAFCLPALAYMMEGRLGLTELGPDRDAIFEEARGDLLFDLGLGRRVVSFCLRTSDAALIRRLRGSEGRLVYEDPSLMADIISAAPARVAVSRLARIEVTNPIPSPGGESPQGPHTHLMPGLARLGRAHDANIPVPEGHLPCLTLYPAHPARDAEGRERAFDARMHADYQRLLEHYGDPEYVAAKRSDSPPRNRRQGLGQLIAARQRAMTG